MALPSWLVIFMGGRHFQCRGPSPTLGSLEPSHQRRHKSWVLWAQEGAHKITLNENLRNNVELTFVEFSKILNRVMCLKLRFSWISFDLVDFCMEEWICKGKNKKQKTKGSVWKLGWLMLTWMMKDKGCAHLSSTTGHFKTGGASHCGTSAEIKEENGEGVPGSESGVSPSKTRRVLPLCFLFRLQGTAQWPRA